MPLLARRVNGSLWANAADDAVWAGSEYPIALMNELVDRHGGNLSVWQVESASDPNLKRIVAAIVAGPASVSVKEIPTVEFRLVERSQIEALGISVAQTSGGLRDAGINSLHYELGNINSARGVQLLRLMRNTAKVFPAKVTTRLIAQSIIRKHLPAEVLSKDFLYALHQKKAVKVVLPKK